MRFKKFKKSNYTFFKLIFPGAFFLSLTLFSIFYFSPDSQIYILPIPVSSLYLFIFSFLGFTYTAALMITKNYRRGLLITGFLGFYIILRLNDLKEPIFFFLLAGLFMSVEVIFSGKSKKM